MELCLKQDTYEVIVNAPNENLKLKPGITANITVYTVEKSDVQTLPNKVFNYKSNEANLKSSKFNVTSSIRQQINHPFL